jgi:hypothetical protein
VLALVEVALGLGERHEDHGAVVFRHAHLEDGRDLVGLDARRRAERGDCAARRHQRDGIADIDAQGIGKARADGYALGGVEAVERAEADIVGDQAQRLDAVLLDAAHETRQRQVRRRCHRLPRSGHHAFTPATVLRRSAAAA